ncbi:MAG: GATA-type transcription factor [Parachlamydiaceae bacterium]
MIYSGHGYPVSSHLASSPHKHYHTPSHHPIGVSGQLVSLFPEAVDIPISPSQSTPLPAGKVAPQRFLSRRLTGISQIYTEIAASVSGRQNSSIKSNLPQLQQKDHFNTCGNQQLASSANGCEPGTGRQFFSAYPVFPSRPIDQVGQSVTSFLLCDLASQDLPNLSLNTRAGEQNLRIVHEGHIKRKRAQMRSLQAEETAKEATKSEKKARIDRKCVSCSTEVTSQWRKGSREKTWFCNACGLRDRRAKIRSGRARSCSNLD